jgi:hypothetical protein
MFKPPFSITFSTEARKKERKGRKRRKKEREGKKERKKKEMN